MTTTTISVTLKCRCGGIKFEPDNPKPTDMLTCVKCGAKERFRDVQDRAVGQVKAKIEKDLNKIFKK